MFINNRAFFLEKKFFDEETDAIKIKLDKVQQVEEPTQTSKNIEQVLIRSNLEPIIKVPLRKSNKVLHQPDRYYDLLVWDSDLVELNENDKDLITYIDAMQRSDSD